MKHSKILLISFSNNYDHQQSLYCLYKSLRDNYACFDVKTYGIANPKYKFDYCKDNLFIDAPKKPGLSFRALNLPLINKIVKYIRREKIKYLYFESLHIWNAYLILKLKREVVLLHSIHDVIPHEGSSNSFFLKLFNNFIIKFAKKVILRSKVSLDYIKRKYSKKYINKFFYMPLGREIIKYDACTNNKEILFFGRLTKYKGLEALYKICSHFPNNVFNIVGKPLNKEDKKIATKIAKLPNVKTNFNYVGQEEMKFYFHKSDFIILPYSSATQSGVIVDANLMSRPCIAFAVGGVKEQIIHLKTGLLVENKFNDFVSAINLFLNLKAEEMDDFCKNSYNFAVNNHSPIVVSKYFYKILLEGEEGNDDCN